jgi:SAM-dependent methyltransferase
METVPAPRLYAELAEWWPLLSAPEEYAEEAASFQAIFKAAGGGQVVTLLELGSGGGNNASHLKARFQMTLVDLSEGMLAVSRKLNPECPHCRGDMRTVRLDRQFDGVLVHDAIMYMTTESDLRQVFETAYVHCREGGVALFVPDCVRETFQPDTEHGGHDGAGRALRYMEWTWDPDPLDSTFLADFAYLLRQADGSVTAEHDRHVLGVFSRSDWVRWLEAAGFEVSVSRDEYNRDLFVGLKQAR